MADNAAIDAVALSMIRDDGEEAALNADEGGPGGAQEHQHKRKSSTFWGLWRGSRRPRSDAVEKICST